MQMLTLVQAEDDNFVGKGCGRHNIRLLCFGFKLGGSLSNWVFTVGSTTFNNHNPQFIPCLNPNLPVIDLSIFSNKLLGKAVQTV